MKRSHEFFPRFRPDREQGAFVTPIPIKPQKQFLFAAIIALGVTLFGVGIAYGPLGFTLSDVPAMVPVIVGLSVLGALRLSIHVVLRRVRGENWEQIRTGGVKPFSGSSALDCAILAAICLGLVGIIMLLMN